MLSHQSLQQYILFSGSLVIYQRLSQPVKIAVFLHVVLPCSAGGCCGILPIGNVYKCQGLTTFVERINKYNWQLRT